jgi:uncharacterized protein with GYD domain
MPKYLFISSFTSEGIKGVTEKGGTARVEAAREAAKSLGGSVESYYFGFGSEDAYVTCTLPDNAAAAALAMAASGSGMVGVRTVVLLTAEEVDAVAQRQVQYRPPGG